MLNRASTVRIIVVISEHFCVMMIYPSFLLVGIIPNREPHNDVSLLETLIVIIPSYVYYTINPCVFSMFF